MSVISEKKRLFYITKVLFQNQSCRLRNVNFQGTIHVLLVSKTKLLFRSNVKNCSGGHLLLLYFLLWWTRRVFTPGFVIYKKGCTRLASDNVYQLLVHDHWFSPASSTTKTGRHDRAEIVLKATLKNKKINSKNQIYNDKYYLHFYLLHGY